MQLYIPNPDEWTQRTRITLTFKLGDADIYHRNMTVPGIGGLRFVRQLSWSTMGIGLARELNASGINYRAHNIANAIEALGCKLEFRNLNEGQEYKYLGILAFKRNPKAFLFKELSKDRFYVQNTYRQNVVSALADLEICKGSTRFDQMQLSNVGNALVEAFGNTQIRYRKLGNGKSSVGSVHDFLNDWVRGNNYDPLSREDLDFYYAIGPATPSKVECNILLKRLETPVKIAYDPNRRINLIRIMENLNNATEEELCEAIKRAGHKDHYKQIKDAKRFNAMRNSAIALLLACTKFVKSRGAVEVLVSECCKDNLVNETFLKLKNACLRYRNNLHKAEFTPNSSKRFAEKIGSSTVEEGVKFLVLQENNILDCVNNKLRPLNLFHNFLNNFENTKQAEELSRITQWNTLWNDIRGGLNG